MSLLPQTVKVENPSCERYLTHPDGKVLPNVVNDFPVDLSYIPPIEIRLTLAGKIDRILSRQKKVANDSARFLIMNYQNSSKNDWFLKKAAEVDLDIEEDLYQISEILCSKR